MRSILDIISKRIFLITVICLSFVSLSVSAQGIVPVPNPLPLLENIRPWVVLVVLVWEYLVGKTKVVKANSTIEMIENGIKFMFGIKQEELKAY